MKTRYIPTIVLVLVASGCSKNQFRTNRVEGTWDITRVQRYPASGTGFTSADPEGTFTFESCKLNKEDFCPFVQQSSYVLEGRTYTANVHGEYRFAQKGRQLEIHEPNADGSYSESVFYVPVFRNSNIQLEKFEADGSKTIFTLER